MNVKRCFQITLQLMNRKKMKLKDFFETKPKTLTRQPVTGAPLPSTWTVPNWPPSSVADEASTESTVTLTNTSPTTNDSSPACCTDESMIEWKAICLIFIALVIVLSCAFACLWATLPEQEVVNSKPGSSVNSVSEFSLPRPVTHMKK